MHVPIQKANRKQSVKHHHLRRLCNVTLQGVKGHNGARLRPSHPHPAHVLSSGMFLGKSAIWNIERVTVCLDCERALSQDKLFLYAFPIICGLVRYHGCPRLVVRRDNRATG